MRLSPNKSNRELQGSYPTKTRKELFFNKKFTFEDIRETIGDNYVKMSYLGKFFKVNPDDTIDWTNPIGYDDFILNLIDYGLQCSEANIRRVLASNRIKEVTNLHIISESILQKEWNGETDYIGNFVKALNLKGNLELNDRLLRKAILTGYGLAFQGIDPLITHRVSPRVLPIIYSDGRELGKSSALRWLGLGGRLLEAIPELGQDVYVEIQGGLTKDDREFKLMLSSGLLINFDDVGELMMSKNKDGLKSICTMTQVQQRTLFTDKIAYEKRRASIWGSTNDRILRDENENRFAVFEIDRGIDFSFINKTDPLDLWRQAREECIELGDESNFTKDDTNLVKDIAKNFMYTTPLEDIVKASYIYDPDGELKFIDIRNTILENGISNPSTNHISKAIKKIVPEGQKEKRIINGSHSYRIRRRTEEDNRTQNSKEGGLSEGKIIKGRDSIPF